MFLVPPFSHAARLKRGGGGGPPGPTPADPSLAWYAENLAWNVDGSALATDGQTVESWWDTVDSFSLFQSTGAARPVWNDNQVNGYPALTFDGAKFLHTTAPAQAPAAAGWWLVVAKIDDGGDQVMVDSWQSGGGRQCLYKDSAETLHAYSASLNATTTASTVQVGAWNVYGAIFNDGGDSTVAYSGADPGGGYGTLAGTPDTIEDFIVGVANGGVGGEFVGQIAAVLRGNSVVTYEELQARADLLCAKYGIAALLPDAP